MATYETTGIEIADGRDVTADITVQGDEHASEIVHFEAHDAVVRAMQAIEQRKHPDECNGIRVAIDWDRKFELLDEEAGDG